MLYKIFKLPYLIWVSLSFSILLLMSMIPLFLSSFLPKPQEEKMVFVTIKIYSYLTCFIMGIIPKVYNKKVLQDEKRVILPNHTSYLDPVSIYIAQDRPFKTLGKVEVARIPVFGYLYKKSVILVDRSSKDSKKEAFQEMEKYIKFEDIALFPQGTITESALFTPTIYPGGFLLAKQYHSAIYPILFMKNEDRLNTSDIWKMSPGSMPILLLQPIPSQIVIDYSVKEVMKLYTEYMQSCLDHVLESSYAEIGPYSEKKLQELIAAL